MKQHNNIVTFYGHDLRVRRVNNRRALTAEEIGVALEYADPRDATNLLFNRNRDEFEKDTDYSTVKLMSEAGPRETNVFFDTGCMLLAMFSNQPKAKEFRKWAKHVLTQPTRLPKNSLVKAKEEGFDYALAVMSVLGCLATSKEKIEEYVWWRQQGLTRYQASRILDIKKDDSINLEDALACIGIDFPQIDRAEQRRLMQRNFVTQLRGALRYSLVPKGGAA